MKTLLFAIFLLFSIIAPATGVAELLPGQKAPIYIFLNFDGDPNFPTITWQHNIAGLSPFTAANFAVPADQLQQLKDLIVAKVRQDYLAYDNVHVVTDTSGLNFWHTWGIDNKSYVFSTDGSTEEGNDPQYFSPIVHNQGCPEVAPHGCARLFGKAAAYRSPDERDQFGTRIFHPTLARTFAGSMTIPSGGPSPSNPPLILGDRFTPTVAITLENIANAISNSATHEVAHLFRVGHPPANCGNDCRGEVMRSLNEEDEARRNKWFVLPEVTDRLNKTLTIAATADILEPDNTPTQVATLQAQQYRLTLHDPFDEDYLKYTVPANSRNRISFAISHEFPEDDQGLRELIDVEVYKNSALYFTIPTTTGWRIEDNSAQPGDEFLIIVRQERKRLPVEYTLQVDVGNDLNEINGGNNTEDTATPWSSDTLCDFTGLSIGNGSDVDYYTFNSLGGSIEVDILYDPSYGELSLSVDGQTNKTVIAQGIRQFSGNLEEHHSLSVYDTDRDQTWLKDTSPGGRLNFADANAYVEQTNHNHLLGGQNWHLPRLDIADPCTQGSNCTQSDLGHLYYTELGNSSGLPPSGGLHNRGPFLELGNDAVFWFETIEPVHNEPFVFNFFNGFQTTANPGSTAYTWMVHDGDLTPNTGLRHRQERITACGDANSLIRVSGPPIVYGLCVRKIPPTVGCPGYVDWTPFSGSGYFNYQIQDQFSPQLITVTASLQRAMFARILSEDTNNVTWQIAAWLAYDTGQGQPVQGTLIVPKAGDGTDAKFKAHVIAQTNLRTWYQKEGSCSAGRSDIINCNANSQCDTSSGAGDGVCEPFDISSGSYGGAADQIDQFTASSGSGTMFWHVNRPTDIGTLNITAALDSDRDCIPDAIEIATGTDPHNDDSDGDGLLDGEEDTDCDGVIDNDPGSGGSVQEDGEAKPGETNPRLFDSDGDGLSDGLERGLIKPHGIINNNPSNFVADADPYSKTNPLMADTDGDGINDGEEDQNQNGKLDEGETSPLVANSQPAPGNDQPGEEEGCSIWEIILWIIIIIIILGLLGLLIKLFMRKAG